MLPAIQPSATFSENLQALPPIDGVERIDLIAADGSIAASIENVAGKKGSLAVYQYLQMVFGSLNAEAAAHGVAVFGEHSDDAKNRPGAHPNIDRLLDIIAGDEPLTILVIPA
jgi:hypothetical protein